MNVWVPLAWIVGLTLLISVLGWIAVRMMQWARKGSKGAALLGWGIGLPAAGFNPQPPPQIQIEELVRDTQAKKNSNSTDPEK